MKTRIAALYIHGPQGTRPEHETWTPMQFMQSVEVLEAMGIREDARYFRQNPDNDRRRQVSLIDEGTIKLLEGQFGQLPREAIKSQIILEGDIHLPELVGQTLQTQSGAELQISLSRMPCYAMDLIKPGLREAMQGGHQGALARVTVSGIIAVGDSVEIVRAQELTPAG